jgi:hypothetical protein
MQSKTLVGFQKGIDRTRTRAVAKDGTFYDLVNCRLTVGGTVQKRRGFRYVASLDPNTKGLFSALGQLHTFYAVESVTEAAGVLHTRLVPNSAASPAPTLVNVHYANAYLGGLYVAAEFSDGTLPQYWVNRATVSDWQADHVYLKTDLIQPTTHNGYYYQPTTTDNPPAWQAGIARAVGDAVQPTVYNGYKYVVTEVDGDSPASGTVEPTWIASEGAIVNEDVDSTPAPSSTTTDTTTPGGDRYDNLPGFIKGILK